MTDPPKRDKFASMAAAAAAAPKRDKLASMMAAASSHAQQDTTAKRDKFASIAAASQQQQSTATITTINDKNSLLQKQMTQRNQALKDLQQAEGCTWQLLTLASKTARSFSNIHHETNEDDVSQLSQQYRDTLQKIHSILSPHASLVVAYQNHVVDKQQDTVHKKQNVNMYAARVELRLAQERRNVVKELLRLEQQETTPRGESTDAQQQVAAAAGEKRKRD